MKADALRGHLESLILAVVDDQPLHGYAIAAYGQEQRWQASVAPLDSSIRTGCPQVVTVRQYPDTWQFSYRSTVAAAECP